MSQITPKPLLLLQLGVEDLALEQTPLPSPGSSPPSPPPVSPLGISGRPCGKAVECPGSHWLLWVLLKPGDGETQTLSFFLVLPTPCIPVNPPRMGSRE